MGLVVVWGPPKCAKHFGMFDLSMHIALGRQYRERRVQKGTVVYLALEGGRALHSASRHFAAATASPMRRST